MTKEALVKLIIEKYCEVKIDKFASYKKYKTYLKINEIFCFTLNKEQTDLYLQREESYMNYIIEKENEIVGFVLDFIKWVNQL